MVNRSPLIVKETAPDLPFAPQRSNIVNGVSFYPEKIYERSRSPRCAGKPANTSAAGAGVGLECGSFVRFYLVIDTASGRIREARFKTNGCAFAVAAADVMAESITGKDLTGLHGLDGPEYHSALLGEYPSGRLHCREMGLEALRAALAGHRASVIEEFKGEKALICTCFGVSEETIEREIATERPETVEDVARITRAGGGCGSCRMLVQEMLDQRY
jgi:NifU-like protein